MGWRCMFKSNLEENKAVCDRRIWMISGVPCMVGCVVNYSEGHAVVGVLWKTCLP